MIDQEFLQNFAGFREPEMTNELLKGGVCGWYIGDSVNFAGLSGSQIPIHAMLPPPRMGGGSLADIPSSAAMPSKATQSLQDRRSPCEAMVVPPTMMWPASFIRLRAVDSAMSFLRSHSWNGLMGRPGFPPDGLLSCGILFLTSISRRPA